MEISLKEYDAVQKVVFPLGSHNEGTYSAE